MLANHVLNAVSLGRLSRIMSKHLPQSSVSWVSVMVASVLFLLLLHCKVTSLILNFKTTFLFCFFAVFKGPIFQSFVISFFFHPFFFLQISNVLIYSVLDFLPFLNIKIFNVFFFLFPPFLVVIASFVYSARFSVLFRNSLICLLFTFVFYVWLFSL